MSGRAVARLLLLPTRRSVLASRSVPTVQRVTASSTSTGGVASKPFHYPLGIVFVLALSVPFTYAGAFMAKSFASYLEDFDLFVPDDDDD